MGKAGVDEIRRIWELNEIVYVADVESHKLVYMNRLARELYGLKSLEDIEGKNATRLYQTV